MTPAHEALARRAVACPRWRWMGGMRWIDNRPAPLEPIALRVADIRPRDGSDVPRHALPDLEDPATLGCLLALVREAWSNPDLLVQRDGHLFVVNPTPKGSPPFGDLDALTEAAVLVAALEAAP